MDALVPMPLRESERAELVRLRGVVDTYERPVVEMAVELAELREVARHARVLVDTVEARKVRGWHKTPMREVERLANALRRARK